MTALLPPTFKKQCGTIAAVFLLAQLCQAGEETSKMTLTAVKITETITIDGSLQEAAWHRPGETHFTQRDPVEGAPPSERTEVWIAYDDAFLYVAARMYDSSPDSLLVRLSRRDGSWNSDGIGFYVDPYYDRRTGYYFALNAAGTLFDGTLYNDDWDDNSWDGVWEGKVQRDQLGWTAEMRIPFSQLRFHMKENLTWGVNFRRDIARKSEIDFLAYTPKNASGFVSRFPDLIGIQGIAPSHQVELLPYATTRAEFVQHQNGDPFNSGARYVPNVGLDAKLGLGSNLTLDATINPDFGQVEVDPAVVNLSDVETFYDEKRPFFNEGASTFRFGNGGATNYWNFNFSSPSLFYTRRIGRTPEGSLPGVDFADVPAAAKILGAAKLTGKLGEGWNLGTVQAVTSREFADIQSSGQRSRIEVEPLTYYGVVRGQQEFNGGKQAIGFMSTTAARAFSDDRLRDELNSRSYVLGLDGWTFLDNEKSWVVTGWGAVSQVCGNQTRMLDLQRNSQHYLQRPDATHLGVDSNATSLTGYAYRIYLNKQSGSVKFNASLGVLSPRFESNDLGFLYSTDIVNMHVGGGYQWVTPTNWYQRLEVDGAVFRSYDFDGDITWEGLFAYGNLQFLDFSTVQIDGAYNPSTVNTRRTRGGPLTLNPAGYQLDLSYSTDSRKPVVLNLSSFMYKDRDLSWNIRADIELHPSTNVTCSIGPAFEHNGDQAQWVDAFDDPTSTATFGRRYVFAQLRQTTVSANIRLNWTFTPQLSLQLFVQPLISAADYSNFKELARPRSYEFTQYGSGLSTIAYQNGSYVVDPDGNGPAPSYSFSNPSFNLKSLRGNAVLRWEYMPGSSIYFVWTQSRSRSDVLGDFQFNQSVGQLFTTMPDNIFMVKLSYWWNR